MKTLILLLLCLTLLHLLLQLQKHNIKVKWVKYGGQKRLYAESFKNLIYVGSLKITITLLQDSDSFIFSRTNYFS